MMWLKIFNAKISQKYAFWRLHSKNTSLNFASTTRGNDEKKISQRLETSLTEEELTMVASVRWLFFFFYAQTTYIHINTQSETCSPG